MQVKSQLQAWLWLVLGLTNTKEEVIFVPKTACEKECGTRKARVKK